MDGSLDEEDDPEIKKLPEITPENATTSCTLGTGGSPFRRASAVAR
jgi:hypothetical protein